MRKGFTLTECMVAGAIFCVTALALLQGIPMVNRIATENAQLLAADAVAWDAAWKTFNVPNGNLPNNYNLNAVTADYTALKVDNEGNAAWPSDGGVKKYALGEEAAPELWNQENPALLMIAVSPIPTTNDVVLAGKMGLVMHNEEFPQQKRIWVDVEWGPSTKRMRLSNYHTLYVDQSGRSRIPWEVQ